MPADEAYAEALIRFNDGELVPSTSLASSSTNDAAVIEHPVDLSEVPACDRQYSIIR